MDKIDYKHNLFLSWTGADSKLKNQIREYFEKHGAKTEDCYDSARDCNSGHFRDECLNALRVSKVYLLLLTDSLFVNSRERISEALNEFNTALDEEAKRNINIVVLCTSASFRQFNPHLDGVDSSDVRLSYYNGLGGRSLIYADPDDNGQVSEEILDSIYRAVTKFISARDSGKPELSQAKRYDVEYIAPAFDNAFYGRADELQKVENAFANGAQIVVLHGTGGIGKTRLANRFAQISDSKHIPDYIQTVHIGEITTPVADCIKLIASKTVFSNAFNSELGRFYSEEDKINAKITSLKNLPEYSLLVVDNLNNLTESALYNLLNLKCRLLITTRANVEVDEPSQISTFSVENLVREDAKKLFEDKSGRQVTDAQFDSVWKLACKHTMTLCIMAGILRSRRKLSVDGLIEMLSNSMGQVEVEINFKHNDESAYKTLLGHLETLFNVSDLTEEERKILCNMSILSDGTMELDQIVEYLDLPNDNSVYRLKSKGWLDSREAEEEELFTVHQIIAQLMQEIFKPTEQTVGGMIKYLCDVYDSSKNTMLYNSAKEMEEKLFHAIVIFARYGKKLCMPLWDRFCDIFHRIGDTNELEEKRGLLVPLLDDVREKGTVELYCDVSNLEINPEGVAKFEEQLAVYTIDKNNYKRILQALSMIGKHLRPEDLPSIYRLMGVLVKVAMAQNDDLAVLVCLQSTSKDFVSVNEIKKYIKRRRSEGGEAGVLLATEVYAKIIFGYGDILHFWNVNQELAEIPNAEDKLTEFYDKNPVLMQLIELAQTKFPEIPESDSMSFFFKTLSNLVMVNDNGEWSGDEEDIGIHFNVDMLFDMMRNFLNLQQKNGLTLMSTEQMANNFVHLMGRIPYQLQSKIVDYVMTPVTPVEQMTLEDSSNASIACTLGAWLVSNSESKNEQMKEIIYEKSIQMLRLQEKNHSRNHYKVIDELVRHANLCITIGRYREGLSALKECFDRTKAHFDACGEGTKRLYDISYRVLSLGVAQAQDLYDVQWFKTVFATAMKIATEKQKIELLLAYIPTYNKIFGASLRARRFEEIDYAQKLYRQLFELTMDVNCQAVADNAMGLTNLVWDTFLTVYRLTHKTPLDEKYYLDFFRRMQSCSNSNATIANKIMELFYVWLLHGEDNVWQCFDLCLKHKFTSGAIFASATVAVTKRCLQIAESDVKKFINAIAGEFKSQSAYHSFCEAVEPITDRIQQAIQRICLFYNIGLQGIGRLVDAIGTNKPGLIVSAINGVEDELKRVLDRWDNVVAKGASSNNGKTRADKQETSSERESVATSARRLIFFANFFESIVADFLHVK